MSQIQWAAGTSNGGKVYTMKVVSSKASSNTPQNPEAKTGTQKTGSGSILSTQVDAPVDPAKTYQKQMEEVQQSDTYKKSPEREDAYQGKTDEYLDKRTTPEYKSKLDPQWNQNLAQQGQLTGRGFTHNLQLSRLADAYNNRRHLKATDIGHRTLHYGTTGTGADNAGSERWQPIETQEMRQMRENEAINKQVRQNDVERQNKVRNYAYDLNNKIDNQNLGYVDYERKGTTGLLFDIERARIDSEYAAQQAQKLRQQEAIFEQKLRLKFSEAALKLILSYGSCKEVENMLYQILGGTYGYAASAIEQALSESYDERVRAIYNDARAQGKPITWGDAYDFEKLIEFRTGARVAERQADIAQDAARN